MSDFESGLATEVRLLSGEQSSRSGAVSAPDASAALGTECAHCGAQGGAEAKADALDEAADAAMNEDGTEWPFNGLDEMVRYLRQRADDTRAGRL